MKTIILFSFIFYCCGCVTAYQVTTQELTITKSDNLSTHEPMIDPNGSSPWVPPQSFASGALSAFTVIAVSELGDKTFFIAVVLALTHSPLCVFLGAISALAFMTLLSAGLGMVSTVIPDFWVQCVSAILFLVFGIKMLREGYKMNSTACQDEFEDVQKSLDSKMGKVVDVESGTKRSVYQRCIRWVFLEAFVMTFLAEWGDRSQITTVVLAAKDNVVGVVVGATLGHAACTLLAVVGGRIVADRVSLRAVTIAGGLLFFVFAIITIVNAVLEYQENSSPS